MNEYANKLSGCCDGIAQFINKGKARTEQIDFSKEQNIIEFLDKKLDEISEMHNSFIQKRKELIKEWKSTAFVCIMGKAQDVFSVKVKKENDLFMRNSEPLSLKEAEALAASLGVPVTRYISDRFAQKYGISNLHSIRDKFDTFYEAEALITLKTTKNRREPLAIDITSLVIQKFSYKSALPDIFDIDINKKKTKKMNDIQINLPYDPEEIEAWREVDKLLSDDDNRAMFEDFDSESLQHAATPY